MITLKEIKDKARLVRKKLGCYVSVEVNIEMHSSNTEEVYYTFYDAINNNHVYFKRIQDLMTHLDSLLSDEPDQEIKIEEE